MKQENGLNPKQQAFVNEYVKDFNGTQAAIRAGYSKKTANEQAAQLLAKLSIQQAVKGFQQKVAQNTEVTVESLILELKKIAFSDVGKYLEPGNEVTDIAALPPEVRAAVASVKKTVTEFDGGSKTSVGFTLHSKLQAIEMLAKHLGFYEKDNKQKGITFKVGYDD